MVALYVGFVQCLHSLGRVGERQPVRVEREDTAGGPRLPASQRPHHAQGEGGERPHTYVLHVQGKESLMEVRKGTDENKKRNS